MEKVYAKIYGSYEKIELGWSGKAFRDLTGAPYLNFKRENESEEEGFRIFKEI